jgi:demethylmenaquinone methyltransferase/2-methoxy-6-polyprenyl-1,4-benzoquinol methylase
MLIRAVAKAHHTPRDARPVFLEADALALPFAGGSLDLVTAAFGFRNLANYSAGLAELCRVLRPGGQVAILEFSEPQGAVFGGLYRFYFRRVLPIIGGLVSGNSQAYSYLPASVSRFPDPQAIVDLMKQAGLREANFESWMGGAVTLYTAQR